MKEAVKAIAALSGRNVIVAAPSSSAVGILKKDDFSKSDTVQRFMLDELLQEAASPTCAFFRIDLDFMRVGGRIQ